MVAGGYGGDDDVALVALDGFEVLDEETVESAFREVVFEVRAGCPRLLKKTQWPSAAGREKERSHRTLFGWPETDMPDGRNRCPPLGPLGLSAPGPPWLPSNLCWLLRRIRCSINRITALAQAVLTLHPTTADG